MSDRLPTGLLVETVLAPLNGQGLYYYIHQKGNHASGLLLIKLSDTKGLSSLVTQERDYLEDTLKWVNPLPEEKLDESQCDAYIQRAKQTDPDLWIIEIEDPDMNNPFKEF